MRYGGLLLVLSMAFLAGCATRPSREGVMSKELPLTLDDLVDIRDGEKFHENVLEEYALYDSPKLEGYLNKITASIAAIAVRPNMPYRVFLLDDDEVNAFGGPGGYIYITRGMLNFVESEGEVAAIISHEIAHISTGEYSTIPQISKGKKAYDLLLRGTELAKDSIGTYGTAANYALKGMRKAGPILQHRFSQDQEVAADEQAFVYMMNAGYDPRGLQSFNDRLARIEIDEVSKFVHFMNVHPPFPARREIIYREVSRVDFQSGKIEFHQDMLSEMRRMPDVVKLPDTVIFEPTLGAHPGSPLQMSEVAEAKGNKLAPQRKRYSWF